MCPHLRLSVEEDNLGFNYTTSYIVKYTVTRMQGNLSKHDGVAGVFWKIPLHPRDCVFDKTWRSIIESNYDILKLNSKKKITLFLLFIMPVWLFYFTWHPPTDTPFKQSFGDKLSNITYTLTFQALLFTPLETISLELLIL